MFKNATVIGFKPPKGLVPVVPDAHKFAPPSSVELLRSGWSPVRDDQYVYTNAGHALLNFTTEKKILPAAAVKLVADAKAAELAEQQGFPLGKKAMKDLKEQVTDELLPRALTTRSTTRVWLDPKAGRIVIDSASSTVVDTVQVALVRAFGDLGLQDVAWPRAKVLTAWLDDVPADFTNDDAVTLQYPGEKGKVVKFANADLGYADVLTHVRSGAAVQAMAMTFDSKISFVMTDNAQLRRIRALDVLKETADAAKDVDRFDSDFVLMTGELGRLFDALAAEA